MAAMKRFKTKYPGVFYIEGKGVRGSERIYYIIYRKGGKLVEEKAGKQFQDDMTPAKAAKIRANRIDGQDLSNVEKRKAKQRAEEEEKGKMTISRLWDLYKEDHKDMRSFASDKSRYRKFLESPFGDKEPKEIVPLDVDRLRHRILKEKAAQTTKHVLTLLGRIVNLGAKKQLCQGLVFQIDTPNVDNLITETLSEEQLKRLLDTLNESKDIQVATLMKLAINTGMRKGELLKLKWSDIDFERDFIFIRSPKGKKSVHIPMSKSVRSILERHPRTGEYVFCNPNGQPFVEIRKRINVIRQAAKLPEGFRPLHGLRHVYASMLASSGQVDMYTLQKLLTHKSPVMTQRYAHLRDEVLKKSANLASSIIDEIAQGGDEKAEVKD